MINLPCLSPVLEKRNYGDNLRFSIQNYYASENVLNFFLCQHFLNPERQNYLSWILSKQQQDDMKKKPLIYSFHLKLL